MSKKEKISQQTLMEVLTHEIETMNAAAQKVNEVAPAVSRKLDEVKNMTFTADVNPHQINQMEAIFKRFLTQLGDKLPQRVLLPKWLIISIIIMFFSLAVSVGYNFIQRAEIKALNETARYWYDTAVEHGYKPKN